ncbi:MAG: YggS family pyridoxal phosphate-dependent enzyme [Alphaproteobacteria bacterium]|nr:YggS family pyridoxal phosphate-dependent enzyme [Alphaproteobacteria bacterium]
MSDSVLALHAIQTRIAEAITAAHRARNAVQLIAVSKTFEAVKIEPVLTAGQKVFGENRVQEAQQKWPQLRQQYGVVDLHLIGPLQTNKVKEAVALFDVIQTVDRPKLVSALAREVQKTGAKTQFYIQVNTGREPQKAGVLPEDFENFMAAAKTELGNHIVGLMCIPPAHEDPRPHFQLLRAMAEAQNISCLSMGMSADFEIAVAEGATHVRVGSAIFGSRPKPEAIVI